MFVNMQRLVCCIISIATRSINKVYYYKNALTYAPGLSKKYIAYEESLIGNVFHPFQK